MFKLTKIITLLLGDCPGGGFKQIPRRQRCWLKKEQNQRNLIEGKFGQGKNAYGLNNIQAKRSDTSQSWIACIFFVINLIRLENIAKQYAMFCALFKKAIYNTILTTKIYPKQRNTSLMSNLNHDCF